MPGIGEDGFDRREEEAVVQGDGSPGGVPPQDDRLQVKGVV
ncbi:MAG: hypothetical protein V9G20_18375 [Candidatus Promineifilaceae bacterium]